MTRSSSYAWLVLAIGWGAACGEVTIPSNCPAEGDPACGDLECAAYLDQTPLGTVTFTVVNHRKNTILIGDGACSGRFWIQAKGSEPHDAETPSYFDLTCKTGQTDFIATGCESNLVVPIAPGASAGLPWNGLIYERRPMPDACYNPEPPEQHADCDQGMTPKAGALDVVLWLYLSGKCEDGVPTCNPEGDRITLRQTFDYPNDKEVAIYVE